jgi:hypothetical protein
MLGATFMSSEKKVRPAEQLPFFFIVNNKQKLFCSLRTFAVSPTLRFNNHSGNAPG